MGRKNDELTHFFGKAAILADLYNGCLYDGRKEILPYQLADMQRVYHEERHGRDGKKRRSRRERDAAKVLCRGGHFMIIAAELQDKLHYCMPLRCMEYDAEDLRRQLRRLKESYRRNGGLETAEEYLSGIKKTDRLIPVVTILLYHGEGKWTSASRLSDMLDLTGMDAAMKGLMNEYRLHVFNLTDLDENKFETGLRELIGMVKRKDDEEELLAYCRENAERLSGLDEDTYDLICTMLNKKTLIMNKDSSRNRKEDTVNMCKALDDLERHSKEKGIAIGRELGEKRGEKRGEERLGMLITRLAQDDRMKEALSAAKSVRVRRRLYQEYGI